MFGRKKKPEKTENEILADALNQITDELANIKKDQKKRVTQTAKTKKKPSEPNKTASLSSSTSAGVAGAKPIITTGSVKEKKARSGLKWYDKLKEKLNPTTTYLINMRYSNGTCKEFIVKSKEETFTMRGRTYYLRYEDSYWNLSMKMYVLYFHEDHASPIDKEIKLSEDKNADPGKEKAYFHVRPHVLKDLIKMEYIRQLAKAGDLEKYLKLALIAGLLTVGLGIATVLKLYRG